jgi:peroxiredoxin
MDDGFVSGLVGLGEAAPNFELPLVASDATVTLGDYRSKAPLLLVLLRSFECPFCRRQLAALKATADALRALGIETLAVTTTAVKAARLYAKYRPPGLPLASDPKLGVHRAFGVPIYRFSTDEPTRWPTVVNVEEMMKTRLKPTDEFPDGRPLLEAGDAMDEADGFEIIETDEAGPPDDVSPLVSYFFIDRDGIVRWRFVDALDDPSDYGSHPSHQQLLDVAAALSD